MVFLRGFATRSGWSVPARRRSSTHGRYLDHIRLVLSFPVRRCHDVGIESGALQPRGKQGFKIWFVRRNCAPNGRATIEARPVPRLGAALAPRASPRRFHACVLGYVVKVRLLQCSRGGRFRKGRVLESQGWIKPGVLKSGGESCSKFNGCRPALRCVRGRISGQGSVAPSVKGIRLMVASCQADFLVRHWFFVQQVAFIV